MTIPLGIGGNFYKLEGSIAGGPTLQSDTCCVSPVNAAHAKTGGECRID